MIYENNFRRYLTKKYEYGIFLSYKFDGTEEFRKALRRFILSIILEEFRRKSEVLKVEKNNIKLWGVVDDELFVLWKLFYWKVYLFLNV